MKLPHFSPIILGLVIIAAIAWFCSPKPTPVTKTASQAPERREVVPPPLPRVAPATPVTSGGWQKYGQARETALQSSPALKAEYASLLKEMESQVAALDNAMLKVDPTIGPILSKVKAARSAKAKAPGNSGNQQAALSKGLTPAEWQRLRTVRLKTLQANSKLMTDSQKLKAKLRLFEAKLSNAMVQVDPTMVSLLPRH